MPEVQVRQQYDAMASWYDRSWQHYLTRTLTFLKGWAQLTPQQDVGYDDCDVVC